jgi:hypothetical protein
LIILFLLLRFLLLLGDASLLPAVFAAGLARAAKVDEQSGPKLLCVFPIVPCHFSLLSMIVLGIALGS